MTGDFLLFLHSKRVALHKMFGFPSLRLTIFTKYLKNLAKYSINHLSHILYVVRISIPFVYVGKLTNVLKSSFDKVL